jgi:hypothetical protein
LSYGTAYEFQILKLMNICLIKGGDHSDTAKQQKRPIIWISRPAKRRKAIPVDLPTDASWPLHLTIADNSAICGGNAPFRVRTAGLTYIPKNRTVRAVASRLKTNRLGRSMLWGGGCLCHWSRLTDLLHNAERVSSRHIPTDWRRTFMPFHTAPSTEYADRIPSVDCHLTVHTRFFSASARGEQMISVRLQLFVESNPLRIPVWKR